MLTTSGYISNSNGPNMERLFLFVLLFGIVLTVHCQSRSNDTTASIIVKDIQSAFSMLSNNTNLLENIIKKMYQPALLQQTEPILIFQLPNEGKSTSTTLWMPRSDFIKPIFPNITRDEMMERIRKLTSSSANTDQWKLFGLAGWNGEMSQHNLQQKTGNDEYPFKEILRDLTDSGGIKTQGEAVTTTKMIEISSNVYIARVNDPFGYSTKWEMKNATKKRTKRDIVELYSMIKCATGCDPLGYKGYGCYCGFSGGGVPVDSIDFCCKVHDKCYEQAGNCISYLEYFVPYVWTCYFGKPLCALDHGEWGGPLSCAARLCYCDVQLSICLRQFICPWKRATCPTRFGRFFTFN